jgi:hypothetical protein
VEQGQEELHHEHQQQGVEQQRQQRLHPTRSDPIRSKQLAPVGWW